MIPYRFTPSYAALRLRRRAERDLRAAKARAIRDIRRRWFPEPPSPLHGWLEVESFGPESPDAPRPFAFRLPVRRITLRGRDIVVTADADAGVLIGTFAGPYTYVIRSPEGLMVHKGLSEFSPAINLAASDSLSISSGLHAPIPAR